MTLAVKPHETVILGAYNGPGGDNWRDSFGPNRGIYGCFIPI